MSGTGRFSRVLRKLSRLFGTLRVGVVGVIGIALLAPVVRSEDGGTSEKTVGVELPKAGILLTFDDSGNIPRWEAQIPLFERYGARATFFLNAPDSIPEGDLTKLRRLQEAGFAIGVHGVHHVRSVKEVEKLGGEEFVRREIEPAIESLKQKGIAVTSFAYPMSDRNETTDRLLLPYFGHLRSGDSLKEGETLDRADRFFVPRTGIARQFCLIGKGCDRMDDATLDRDLFPALERVKNRDEILVLYAHNIADEGKSHFISPEALEKILKRARELDLAFYTYDDLPPYAPDSEPSESPAPKEEGFHFEPERILERGSDGTTCWTHARMAAVPGGMAVLTSQRLLLTGSDVFYGIHSAVSEDGSWSVPPELVEDPAFGRIFGESESGEPMEAIPCDGTPAWHAATGKVLITGHVAFYEKNRVTSKRFPLVTDLPEGETTTKTWFAVFDPATRVWSAPKFLTVPVGSEAAGCGAGCTQRFDLPDGTILLPLYGPNERTPRCSKVVIVRCSFDGETLRWLEEGKPLEWSVPRGLGEPSLVGFDGRYYLTLRNDEKGYLATSDDGLNFSDPIPWRWGNGEEIGNYNTQQHWLTVGGKLALVYTRRAGTNDHVFRHRAPLFCSEFDPATLTLKRETESIAVPERGARLGNFGVTNVSRDESWIVVSEWMQSPRGGGEKGYNDCVSHGATGAIWRTRVTPATQRNP